MERDSLVGKEIDHPIWVEDEAAEDPNDRVDGVEHFFDYLSYQFCFHFDHTCK